MQAGHSDLVEVCALHVDNEPSECVAYKPSSSLRLDDVLISICVSTFLQCAALTQEWMRCGCRSLLAIVMMLPIDEPRAIQLRDACCVKALPALVPAPAGKVGILRPASGTDAESAHPLLVACASLNHWNRWHVHTVKRRYPVWPREPELCTGVSRCTVYRGHFRCQKDFGGKNRTIYQGAPVIVV